MQSNRFSKSKKKFQKYSLYFPVIHRTYILLIIVHAFNQFPSFIHETQSTT